MSRLDQLRADEAGLPLGESHPDEPLVCFPMRLDWEMAQGPMVRPQTFPSPLVTSLDGQEGSMVVPDPVEGLRAYAAALGWRAAVRYSEGWVPHGTTGVPIGPKVLWSVRMSLGASYAVAVREDATWRTLWTVGAVKMTKHDGLLAFKEALDLITARALLATR